MKDSRMEVRSSSFEKREIVRAAKRMHLKTSRYLIIAGLRMAGVGMCSWCGKRGTKRTVKGIHNEQSGGLPQNDGWYCDKCYAKGLEIEKEAIYS